MEVFVDFGLFELLAASGVAALGRFVFRRRMTRILWLTLSGLAPAALIVLSPSESIRWLSIVAFATAIVNLVALAKFLPQSRLDT